jgi:hypothetical protein
VKNGGPLTPAAVRAQGLDDSSAADKRRVTGHRRIGGDLAGRWKAAKASTLEQRIERPQALEVGVDVHRRGAQ